MPLIARSPSVTYILLPVTAIAGYSAYASAAKFAEGQGATTSQVLKHLAPCEDFAAEACAE